MREKPLILSVDTSDRVLGVDVSSGGSSRARRILEEPRIHASMLIPTVLDVLRESGATMQELDAVAVAMGPGSYTGLRIGVSAAKGLCYALDIPLVGIPTMQAIAMGFRRAPSQTSLVTCLTSRRNELYVQAWELAEAPVAVTSVAAVEIDDIETFLNATGRKTFVVTGSGAELLLSSTSDLDGITAIPAPPDFRRPTIHGVALLAFERFTEALFEDVERFEPFYLKDFVAKKGASPFPLTRDR